MNPKQRQSAQWQALPGCGHAERALQASWWQEHGAAHAGGPRAQQASKLETRALFAGSQGGTVARAGGNTCGPLSARLDLNLNSADGVLQELSHSIVQHNAGTTIYGLRLEGVVLCRA